MFYDSPEIVRTIQQVLEILGTFAFAISGIRQAAEKKLDWFGGFVCGFSVAIGGGTLRDVMLGVTPFWMTSPLYITCTLFAQLFVIIFARSLKRLDNAWFAFDTIGLALFTLAGMQKTLAYGHPFWVAIIMGCITGAAGGILRDVLLNKTPVIFRQEIYATASVVGGLLYWLFMTIGINVGLTVITTFGVIVAIRFLSMKYHITLPHLKDEP